MEEAILAGDLDAVLLLAEEDDLIDDYLLGGMTEEERQGFAGHIVSTEQRRQRLAFASALIEYARTRPDQEAERPDPVQRNPNRVLLSWKQAAFLAVAASVLLAALAGFQQIRLRQQGQIASAARNELGQLQAALDSRKIDATPPNERFAVSPANQQVGMDQLPEVEFASTKRSVIPPLLRISPHAKFALIKVKLSEPLSVKYREVLIGNGARLLTLEFPASSLPSTKESTIVLPTWILQKGSYHLQLERPNTEGSFEEPQDWVFNVEK